MLLMRVNFTFIFCKLLVCCLTGYYQPNRNDDVYYWQSVLSPCFIVNQCMVQMKLLLLFPKLIGVTFPKMIFCLMEVRNFQSYFWNDTWARAILLFAKVLQKKVLACDRYAPPSCTKSAPYVNQPLIPAVCEQGFVGNCEPLHNHMVWYYLTSLWSLQHLNVPYRDGAGEEDLKEQEKVWWS